MTKSYKVIVLLFGFLAGLETETSKTFGSKALAGLSIFLKMFLLELLEKNLLNPISIKDENILHI